MLFEYLLTDFFQFTSRVIVVTISLLVVIGFIMKQKNKSKTTLNVMNNTLGKQVLHLKKLAKIKDKTKKTKQKLVRRLFVLNFEGDSKPRQLDALVAHTNMIIRSANPGDEVLVKLYSPGGTVHGYGHAAYQLQRLKNAQLRVICSVDQVAASGGYMMAAAADHIIASPFAIIGSIGVVMTSPNVHRLLQHHLIDVEQVTAGQYKRTLDPFTPNTESARVKTHQDLEVIHEHFKNHIAHHRKKVEIDKVSTGEIWLAMDAINLGLIDKLQSSDDYLLNQIDAATIIEVRDPSKKRGWLAKMGNNITHWLSEKPKVPEAKMPS